MKSYIDDIVVADPNGKDAVLYPRTKQEAVEGLQERLNNIELPEITTTDSTTLPNSHAGRVKFNKIVGGMEQGENPSTDNPQPINGSVISGVRVHGEQLFDVETVEVVKGGIGYQTGAGYDSETSIRTTLIDVIGNQSISMSCDIPMYRVFEYADRTFIKYTTMNNVTESTIALSETTTGIRFVFNVESVTDANIAIIKNTLMVNYGEEIKTHEPYQSHEIALSNPITLYGDVMSAKEIERKYYKQEFVGTGNITEADSYFSIPLAKKGISGGVLCNIDLTARITSNYARISKHDMTLDEFKAYLISNYENGTPAYIVYPLAESVIEELPTADQIALNSLPTYDGITYVEFIYTGVNPTMEAEYGTSKVGGYTLEGLLAGINGELQSQLNNDRITALESAVVNNV